MLLVLASGCAGQHAVDRDMYRECDAVRTFERSYIGRSPQISLADRRRIAGRLRQHDGTTFEFHAMTREELEELAGGPVDADYGRDFILIRYRIDRPKKSVRMSFLDLELDGPQKWYAQGPPFDTYDADLLVAAPRRPYYRPLSLYPPERRSPGLGDLILSSVGVWVTIGTFGYVPPDLAPSWSQSVWTQGAEVDRDAYRAWASTRNAFALAQFEVHLALHDLDRRVVSAKRLGKGLARACEGDTPLEPRCHYVLLRPSEIGDPRRVVLAVRWFGIAGGAWFDLRGHDRCWVTDHVERPLDDGDSLAERFNRTFPRRMRWSDFGEWRYRPDEGMTNTARDYVRSALEVARKEAFEHARRRPPFPPR